jgi:uncharacterized protein YlxW (UPF0749 family)
MKGQHALLIAIIGAFVLIALVVAFGASRQNGSCGDELIRCNTSFVTCNEELKQTQDQVSGLEDMVIKLNNDLEEYRDSQNGTG